MNREGEKDGPQNGAEGAKQIRAGDLQSPSGAFVAERRWLQAPGTGSSALVFLLCLLRLLVGVPAIAAEHLLKADERALFYPTVGWRDADAGVWHVPVHALVFEPERSVLTTAALRVALGLVAEPKNSAERKVLADRLHAFVVDNERGKTISVRVGDREFSIGKSPGNGHTHGEFQFTDAELKAAVGAGAKSLSFQAVTRAGDARVFRGTALLLGDTGLSVISDVDDTIKVSHVRDRHALLQKTFYEPFQAVEGMAAVYRAWATNGATFHYVSASPWQLYEPLAEFTATNGFPAGSWHMKQFRVKDGSFLALLDSPEKYKATFIEPMLRQFPKRRFLLVGDSGERDPEIYGALARQFPTQVECILIRDVTGELATAARYEAAFKDVPAAKWRVFREPGEIQAAVR